MTTVIGISDWTDTIYSDDTKPNIKKSMHILKCKLTESQESTELANASNVGIPWLRERDLTFPTKSSTSFKHVAASRSGLSTDLRPVSDRCATYIPGFSRYPRTSLSQ
jgi:hypothetical protein